MSRFFVTNISRLVDENGGLLTALPQRTRRLAERLGTIITSITENPSDTLKTTITCWSCNGKKRCSGKIDASIDLKQFDIHWYCLVCGTMALLIIGNILFGT